MSCGDPHDLDCHDALSRLYEYIDGEVDGADHAVIAQHLHECGPCLHEYDVEELIKSVVARSCWEHAPDQLRARVLAEIVSVRIRLAPSGDGPGPRA